MFWRILRRRIRGHPYKKTKGTKFTEQTTTSCVPDFSHQDMGVKYDFGQSQSMKKGREPLSPRLKLKEADHLGFPPMKSTMRT